jgi:hypothetical protein
MAYDTYFGFDLIQRKTLEKLLAAGEAGEVTSVNGATGVVVLAADDVGALPDTAVAAFVDDADGTSLATLATSIDALRDSLVTAGLMASS